MKTAVKYLMGCGILALLSSCAGYNTISENDVYMQRPTALNLNEDESDLTSYNAFVARQEGKYKVEDQDPRYHKRRRFSNHAVVVTGMLGYGNGYSYSMYNDPFYRNSLFYNSNGMFNRYRYPYIGYSSYGYYNPYGYGYYNPYNYGYGYYAEYSPFHPYSPYGNFYLSNNSFGYPYYGGNDYYVGNNWGAFNSPIYNKPGANNDYYNSNVHYGHHYGVNGSSTPQMRGGSNTNTGAGATYSQGGIAKNNPAQSNAKFTSMHRQNNVKKRVAQNRFVSTKTAVSNKPAVTSNRWTSTTVSHRQPTTYVTRRTTVQRNTYHPTYSPNLNNHSSRRSNYSTETMNRGDVGTRRTTTSSTSHRSQPSSSSARRTSSFHTTRSYSRPTTTRSTHSYTRTSSSPTRTSSSSSYSRRR